MKSFEQKLADYAKLVVTVGLNVQSGQEVILTVPHQERDFARMLVREAYQAGAKHVFVMFVDEQNIRSRYTHGHEHALDYAPNWYFNGIADSLKSGAARLNVFNEDPNLLADIAPEKIARWSKAAGKAAKPVGELVGGFAINWCLVSTPSPAWATMVFPNESEEQAISKLWDAIFHCCHVNADNPAQSWKDHCDKLELRQVYLNEMRMSALRFKGPGTDLEVGLVDDHVWVGGWGRAKNGVSCTPNIPTEEVFCMPHRDRVNGTVSSTMPLVVRGQVVDKIQMTFKDGVAISAVSATGQEALTGLLDTDEGSRRLGEVALVPADCQVAQTGLLYYNTLFDENAACHIALGECYAENMRGYDDLDADQKLAKGCNTSQIHEDWMIGSKQVDVDAVLPSGEVRPLMRAGLWVDEV